jgi:hypothetical protein
VSAFSTPEGYENKESIGKIWDQVPKAYRGMVCRQIREQVRTGKRRGIIDARKLLEIVMWPEAQGGGHQSWCL